MHPSALLLADGRFPTGGHAHSWGMEAAVARGLVTDLDDVEHWIRGNAATTWWLDAAATALAVQSAGRRDPDWVTLDAEVTARVVSSAARRVSRTQGRHLARAGRAAWPGADVDAVAAGHSDGPLAPLVLGVIADAGGLGPDQAALVGLHTATQGATTAAVRLLGLDPFAAAGVTARLAPVLRFTARRATAVGPDPRDLPTPGTPMLDLLMANHAAASTRLFAS